MQLGLFGLRCKSRVFLQVISLQGFLRFLSPACRCAVCGIPVKGDAPFICSGCY